jgi:hypothetical protein
VDAGREAGEPSHADIPGIASIWYAWTPQESGRVTIDTCTSNFDTVLAVYTGESLGSLTTIGAANDSGCPARSVVSFDALAGTPYRIAVDGFPDSLSLMGGLGVVILTISGPPPNDDLEDAAALEGPLPITSADPAFNSHNASREAGEPNHAGGPGDTPCGTRGLRTPRDRSPSTPAVASSTRSWPSTPAPHWPN